MRSPELQGRFAISHQKSSRCSGIERLTGCHQYLLCDICNFETVFKGLKNSQLYLAHPLPSMNCTAMLYLEISALQNNSKHVIDATAHCQGIVPWAVVFGFSACRKSFCRGTQGKILGSNKSQTWNCLICKSMAPQEGWLQCTNSHSKV